MKPLPGWAVLLMNHAGVNPWSVAARSASEELGSQKASLAEVFRSFGDVFAAASRGSTTLPILVQRAFEHVVVALVPYCDGDQMEGSDPRLEIATGRRLAEKFLYAFEVIEEIIGLMPGLLSVALGRPDEVRQCLLQLLRFAFAAHSLILQTPFGSTSDNPQDSPPAEPIRTEESA